MTDASRVDPQPPFPSYLRGVAQGRFNALGLDEQRCLDDAFMAIEWEPVPEEAQELDVAGTTAYAVVRCGFIVSYEIVDDGIDVWDILPRD